MGLPWRERVGERGCDRRIAAQEGSQRDASEATARACKEFAARGDRPVMPQLIIHRILPASPCPGVVAIQLTYRNSFEFTSM